MPVAELASWLVERSRAAPPLPELFVGFCERLILAGVPVCRASLGLETLHPEESGARSWSGATAPWKPWTRRGSACSPTLPT